MNLLFRVLAVLASTVVGQLRAGRRLRPHDPLATSVLQLRVWPNDLDVNLHMNNGRYLTVMDLGRMDLLVRAGLWGPLLCHRWTALLGGATIRYKRPLGLSRGTS